MTLAGVIRMVLQDFYMYFYKSIVAFFQKKKYIFLVICNLITNCYSFLDNFEKYENKLNCLYIICLQKHIKLKNGKSV